MTPDNARSSEDASSSVTGDLSSREQIWWGLPRSWHINQAEELAEDLTRIWHAQASRSVGVLEEDLNELKRFFDPLAAGRRLRPLLAELPPITIRSPYADEPLVVNVGEERYLLAPEGREVLEALRRSIRGYPQTGIYLSTVDYSTAQGRLLGLYRDWAQAKLRSIVALQQGSAAILLPQGIAMILFLLLNRSTSRERALVRPNSPGDFDAVDEATQRVIAAFSDTLAPPVRRVRRRDQYSLYGGYPLTEARRRLGAHGLVNEGGRIFLSSGSEEYALSRVIFELRRRDTATLARVKPAFDKMVRVYQDVRPILASFRMAFERPASTASLRSALLTGLSKDDPGNHFPGDVPARND